MCVLVHVYCALCHIYKLNVYLVGKFSWTWNDGKNVFYYWMSNQLYHFMWNVLLNWAKRHDKNSIFEENEPKKRLNCLFDFYVQINVHSSGLIVSANRRHIKKQAENKIIRLLAVSIDFVNTNCNFRLIYCNRFVFYVPQMLVMFFDAMALTLTSWNNQTKGSFENGETNRKRHNRERHLYRKHHCAILVKEKWKCSVIMYRFDNGRLIALMRNHKNHQIKTPFVLVQCVLATHQVTKLNKLHMNFSARPSIYSSPSLSLSLLLFCVQI